MTDRTDNFNRADSITSLGTPSDSGSAWTAPSGTWGIASNVGICVVAGANVVAALEASVADADVQATLSSSYDNSGLCARLADDSNHLLVRYNNAAGLQMYKKVAGSYTQLGSTVSFTPSASNVFKFSPSGSTLNFYVDGTLKIGPITESAGSTNTQHGLFSGDTACHWDDFSITGTGGAAAANDDERHFPRGVHRGFARAA